MLTRARRALKSPRVVAWRELAAEAWRSFSERGGRLFAAALAYYALLSLVPAFVIALWVAAIFTDEATARSTLLHHVARWIGTAGAETVGDLLAQAQRGGRHVGVVGVVALVWAATRLFANLTRALDTLWAVPAPVKDTLPRKATRWARRRALAFLLVIGIGLLVAALSLVQMLLAAAREATGTFDVGALRVFESGIAFGVTAAMFTVIYAVLPSARVPWRDAAVGGLWTAALFTAGSMVVTTYVAHKATDSTFGAASSVVLLLLWVHYAAHAFFFGAALTAARARRRGALSAPAQAASMAS